MNLAKLVNHTKIIQTAYGMIFLTSGLLINFLQLVLYVLIRPVSKTLFSKINRSLTYAILSQLVYLQKYWADIQATLFCKKNDYEQYFGKENALLIMNHSYEIDWLIGWCLCEHFGLLGGTKAFVKKSLQYLPTVGFSMKLGGNIFVERNWEKDQKGLENKLKEITKSKDLFWLFLAPEGTRYTKEKYEASREFAKKNGLPELKYHLTPRTKGFTATVPCVRNKVKAIYNINIACKPDSDKPTFTNFLLGKTIEVGFYVERIQIKDLPESEAELSSWLYNLYKKKDDAVHNYLNTGKWLQESNSQYVNYLLPRRKLPAINFIFWGSCVIIPTVYYIAKILLYGNVVQISIALAFFGSFTFILDKFFGQFVMKKASSYGISKK